MTWETLAGFITANDPVFARSLRGAPAEGILRIEREYDIDLPSLYRGFVETMGLDSGGFSLFGYGQTEAYDDLIAALPEAYYPVKRYFRISSPTDTAGLGACDYFLDLSRSDGADAPVVKCEETPDFDPADVDELRFTFGEWVTRQLFRFLVLDRAAHRAMIVLGYVRRDEGRISKDDIEAMLGRANFELALPPLPRVVCLQRGDFGALVDVLADGLGIEIILSAADRQGLDVVIDQLLIRYPNASVSNPDSPPRK